MSVTFHIANSPRHTVTRTWGEEGDGETDTYETDVLPTCNFANSNAGRILALLDIDHEYLCGEITPKQCSDAIDAIQHTIRFGNHDHEDIHRLFVLHTVLQAAVQFNQPVHFA